MTTLGQALRQIAALKGKIRRVEARMQNSVVYNEDKPPAHKFSQLMEQRAELVTECVRLKTATTLVSAKIKLADGRSMCEAVRELAELRASIAFYDGLIVLEQDKVKDEKYETAYIKGEVATITKETVQCCSFPEANKTEYVEKLRDQCTILNAEVEALNNATNID